MFAREAAEELLLVWELTSVDYRWPLKWALLREAERGMYGKTADKASNA